MELRSYAASILAVLIILVGCSGSGSVTTPDIRDEKLPSPLAQADNPVANRQLWGLWDVTIDVQSDEVELVPCRTAMINLNVLRFLEPDGVSNNLQIYIHPPHVEEDYLEVDVRMEYHHPFGDLPQFAGFDVRGIVLGDATCTDLVDPGLSYSIDSNKAGVVMNADGYTRWWNFPEFHGGGMQVFQYTSGAIGNLQEPTATVNPYKYFCDGLAPDDDLVDCIDTVDFIQERGVFRAGAVNSRTYEMRYPRIDDSFIVRFQYAVDASWAMPDPGLSGDPFKIDIPYDFPLMANQREPFYISIENPYYYVWRLQKWPIELEIEVFSWQALDPDAGMFGIEKIILSGYPGSDWPVEYELSGSALDSARVAGSACSISSVWHVEIENPIPGVLGFIPYLITVEPSGDLSYDQGYDQPAPSEPLAAYRADIIEVTSYVPSSGGPEIFCSAYPLDVYPDYEITFDVSDSERADTIYWDWNNDGEYDYTSHWQPYGSNIETHSYSEEGSYQVMIMGMDEFLNEGRLASPIEITVSEECIHPLAVVEADRGSDNEIRIKVGYSIEFDMTGTHGTGPVRWYWDWGDGWGISEVTDIPWIEHEFDEIGIFEVKCIACNDCGSDEIDEPFIIEVVKNW